MLPNSAKIWNDFFALQHKSFLDKMFYIFMLSICVPYNVTLPRVCSVCGSGLLCHLRSLMAEVQAGFGGGRSSPTLPLFPPLHVAPVFPVSTRPRSDPFSDSLASCAWSFPLLSSLSQPINVRRIGAPPQKSVCELLSTATPCLWSCTAAFLPHFLNICGGQAADVCLFKVL